MVWKRWDRRARCVSDPDRPITFAHDEECVPLDYRPFARSVTVDESIFTFA